MESNFNNLNIINVLLRWRVHLIVILIVALLGSVLFSSSLFITPKFKSWAIVYPANISPYSEESETEQMFQIFQASYIRDYVIDKFKLDEHYNISKDYKYYTTALMDEYKENVKISKTPGEALRIEVFDKDPLLAKQMVEAILYAYDQKIRNLHEIKFGEVVALWSRALARKKDDIDSLSRQLAILAKEDGLIEFDIQSSEVTKGILGTVEGGSTRINSKEVDKLKNSMIEKGGLLKLTIESIENEAINLREISKEYDIAYSNYDRKFTYSNIIESPYVADKKSYPVRWLIVVLTMFTTFFLALVFIGIIENIRLRKTA
jgi:capsule polysaccharide export protein KpsE/RkpR